jgi:Asp-tRNA(Asn)/Glu-tRNA(Gln) amidotransferase C subunit
MKGVLSQQQLNVINKLWQSIDTSQLSQTMRLTAEAVKLPQWLVLQEFHYIELVTTIFGYKSVERMGNISKHEMYTYFPLLAPVGNLGISDESSTVLRDEPRRFLEDDFGANRDVSVRYVCELFSLPVTWRDLLRVFKKHFINVYINMNREEAAKKATAAMKEIDKGLKEKSLPTLHNVSNERKALTRFLRKSPRLQRINLNEQQIETLLTIRWANLELADVIYSIDPKGSKESVQSWENEAINILREDDNFATSSSF